MPDGARIESVTVTYPGRDIAIFRWETHWTVIFFVSSIAFALALKKRLNVLL